MLTHAVKGVVDVSGAAEAAPVSLAGTPVRIGNGAQGGRAGDARVVGQFACGGHRVCVIDAVLDTRRAARRAG
jgi:hypothetical protein